MHLRCSAASSGAYTVGGTEFLPPSNPPASGCFPLRRRTRQLCVRRASGSLPVLVSAARGTRAISSRSAHSPWSRLPAELMRAAAKYSKHAQQPLSGVFPQYFSCVGRPTSRETWRPKREQFSTHTPRRLISTPRPPKSRSILPILVNFDQNLACFCHICPFVDESWPTVTNFWQALAKNTEQILPGVVFE